MADDISALLNTINAQDLWKLMAGYFPLEKKFRVSFSVKSREIHDNGSKFPEFLSGSNIHQYCQPMLAMTERTTVIRSS